jgi:hypothetical protein
MEGVNEKLNSVNLKVESHKTFPVLIGDIGGTNARLSIVRMSSVSDIN